MINLTIQVSGKTKANLIMAVDGAASRLEEGQEYAKAEAPDGSGKYSFQVHGDAEPFIFGTHKDVQFMTKVAIGLREEIEKLKKELLGKNETLAKQAEETKQQVEEAKIVTPKKRLRSY